jgi:hypothetical protein
VVAAVIVLVLVVVVLLPLVMVMGIFRLLKKKAQLAQMPSICCYH